MAFNKRQTAANDIPLAIVGDVPLYTGPPWDVNNPTHVPLAPIEVRSSANLLNKFGRLRRQNPIRLSYAMTIHKSQGQTLPRVWITMVKTERCVGLTYVAFSRCRSINVIVVAAVSFVRLKRIEKHHDFQLQ